MFKGTILKGGSEKNINYNKWLIVILPIKRHLSRIDMQ